MKILAWNILSGGFEKYGSLEKTPGRIEGLIKTIKNIDADVVGLIDTHKWKDIYSDEDLRSMFDYPEVICTNLEDDRLIKLGHDNGITGLSKVPDSRLELVRIVTRNAIKISTPSIDIFCLYLDDVSEDTRLSQIDSVLRMVDQNKPTILIGDMNTIDKNDLNQAQRDLAVLVTKFPGPMKTIESSLKEMLRGELTEVLRNKGYRDLGKNLGNTVPAKLFPLPVGKPIIRLDYAFGSPPIKLKEFKVLTDEKVGELSDHYPILIEVE